MGKILDIVDGKLIIAPEALTISPFDKIWEDDKTQAKKSAIEKLKFVWFYCDWESPYYKNYAEDTRAKMIALDVLKEKSYKIPSDVHQAISKYVELYTTPEMRLVDAAQIAVFKMEQFYKNVNFQEDDIKKVSDSIIAMPKLVQAIKDARRAAQTEKDSGVKVRGNAEVGQFEN